MIIEYQRPQTIEDALRKLARAEPRSFALGGGTYLNRARDEQYAVVDLQALGLEVIKISGNLFHVGATSKLQDLYDFKGLPEDLYKAVQLEASDNLRQMATIAGTLVTSTGRSPMVTVLLAMDANLEIQELDTAPRLVKLGDWLPLRANSKPGRLITQITIPINIQLAYEYIARSPSDQPIVCAGLAHWKSGRTRLSLGGMGDAPVLAMDGPEADGIEAAAINAYSHAEDQWGSAEYRQEMAGVLAQRCFQRMNSM